MTRKHHIVGVLTTLALLVSFASCELFVNSPFSGLAQKLDFSNVPTGEIIGSLDDMSSSEKADALAGLGDKFDKNPEAVDNLKASEKNDLLTAQAEATLSGEAVVEIIGSIDFNDPSSMGDVNPMDIISSGKESFAGIDTRAATAILDSVANGDDDNATEFTLEAGVDKAAATTAAVAVLASTISSFDNETFDKFMDDGDFANAHEEALGSLMYYFMGEMTDGSGSNKPANLKSPKAIVDEIFGEGENSISATDAQKKSFTAALKVLAAVDGLGSLFNFGNN